MKNIRKSGLDLTTVTPCCDDFARQARRRQRDLVLRLHLGDVGIGAGLERQRDRRAAVRARGRTEIHQVIDAGQLLLDDLGDGLLDRLGVGALVGRADDDLRRRDRRIRFDAQRRDRDRRRRA